MNFAALLGQFVGSLIVIILLTPLFGHLLFRNWEPDPRSGASTAAAWVFVSAIAGLGFADGGPYAWEAFLWYLPGALAAWLWERRRLHKMWTEGDENP
jgi:hypothetical protein